MKVGNKQILLTGASGGIGSAIARSLDEAGAGLLLAGRSVDSLCELAADLRGPHRVIVADLNEHEGREAIYRECARDGIDMLINAAGVMEFGMFTRQRPEQIEEQLCTNLISPMLLCHRLLRLLLEREESAIVNIGSIFGSIGHPGFTAYCGSKFGLRGFTEALQRELADTPVRVLYLAPRATRTALNSRAVDSLNEALGNTVDPPAEVAREVMSLLARGRNQRYMGWPEKLFVRINALTPHLVHTALTSKLNIIRQHAEQQQ